MNYIRSTGAIALGLVLTAFVTCKGEERAPKLGDDAVSPTGGSAGRGGSSSDEPDASLSEPDASVDQGLGGDAGSTAPSSTAAR